MKIQGFVGQEIFRKEYYKIYSFYPIQEDKDRVILDSTYNNITITGEMPDLFPDIKYELEVEYVKKGKYHNYNVKNVKNTEEKITISLTNSFIRNILTEKQSDELLKHYPDIIERVLQNKEIDIDLLYGIKEKTLNVIKRKIFENFKFMELMEEFSEYGMSFNKIKTLYEAYSSIDVIRQKMNENPYECLCKLNRVGFTTADKIIIKKYPDKINSKYRMESCIFYVLKENEQEGNTWIDKSFLYNKCYTLAQESISYFDDIILNNQDIHIINNNQICRLKTYNCEKEISDILLYMLNSTKKTYDVNYSLFNKIDDIILSDEQMSILNKLCENNLSILTGFGGSGKSQTTKAIINMMEYLHLNYLLLSPTGKAAKVLKGYTGRDTKTIHRGLGWTPEGFSYNSENKFDYDIIIIDEFSMIDIWLLRDLLRAVDLDKTKLLFIGDPAQLPSVGTGNISHDMLESKIIPSTLLTKVFRFNEGGLSYVTTMIRTGQKYLNNDKQIQKFGTKDDYIYINTNQENSIECIKTLYLKLLKQGISVDDIMILSAQNKGTYGTIRINSMIQDLINPLTIDKDEVSYKKENELIVLRTGDKVIQIANNYKAKIYNNDFDFFIDNEDDEENETIIVNGDCGIIKEIHKKKIIIDFDGILVQYSPDDYNQLMLGYALSIHKSQGSNSKYVIVATPKAHKFNLNRNLLYVGTSRAKEKVYHIGTLDAVNHALSKSQNTTRNTFLKEMLLGNI